MNAKLFHGFTNGISFRARKKPSHEAPSSTKTFSVSAARRPARAIRKRMAQPKVLKGRLGFHLGGWGGA